MFNLLLVAATVIPFGLVGFLAYKMLVRKKRPQLKLVETPTEQETELEVEEVVVKANKLGKSKARRGKRRAKKN